MYEGSQAGVEISEERIKKGFGAFVELPHVEGFHYAAPPGQQGAPSFVVPWKAAQTPTIIRSACFEI